MSYFVNKIGGVASLTIGGVQFASSLASFVCTDSGNRDNGYVKTEGQVILKQRPGGASIEDYDRTIFDRGAVVIVDIKDSDGNPVRHPRGYLKVIKSLYDASNEELRLDVGCKISYLDYINASEDDLAPIKNLVRFELLPTRKDFQNLGQAIAADSRFVWCDNQGVIRSDIMFENDSIGSTPPGSWVSVRGVTTVGIQPLDSRDPISVATDSGNGSALPGDFADFYTEPYLNEDAINIEYEVSVSDEDEIKPEDVTITESFYPLNYPVIYITRKPKDEEDPFDDSAPSVDFGDDPGILACPTDSLAEATEGLVSGTGDQGNPEACNLDNFESVRSPMWIAATSTETTTTAFEALGGQQSYRETIRLGPAVEASNQYYADLYHNCVQVNSSTCTPGGRCGTSAGMAQITLSKSTVQYFYNEDGSVAKVVNETWKPRISGAQPVDWRAGKEKGQVQGFKTPERHLELYRSDAQVSTYTYDGATTISEDVSYESITSRSSGISGNPSAIDAYKGIIKTTRRTSIAGNYAASNDPEKPDTIASPEINLETKEFSIPSNSPGEPETVSEVSLPYPIVIGEGSSLNEEQIVAEFAKYTYFYFIGESRGLRIAEAMRDDITSSWKPNQPFRYVDPQRDQIIAMRGSSWSWGVSSTESVVSVDGLFMGISQGNLVVPNNIVGNTTPTFS